MNDPAGWFGNLATQVRLGQVRLGWWGVERANWVVYISYNWVMLIG